MTAARDRMALLALLLAAPAALPAGEPAAKTCSYEVYNWNTRLKRPVNFAKVSRPYAALKAEEKDPASGCTVCLEDQELVDVAGIKPFLVCARIAPSVREALRELLAAGETILEVEGYRPGRTKNPLDRDGNRLGFSNHAYGAALDINRSKNGLYDNCASFGPGCRLLQGGAWKPGSKGSITKEGAVVRVLRAKGFKWGGEIAGRQKDFMHFSASGY